MVYSRSEPEERQFLTDYLTFNGSRFQEHLGYVVEFLRGKLAFPDMLGHARGLPCANGAPRRFPNFDQTVRAISEAEAKVIGRYLVALVSYAEGKSTFEGVDALADTIIDLKPIPESARIPPDSEFYKGEKGRTLADMREQV